MPKTRPVLDSSPVEIPTHRSSSSNNHKSSISHPAADRPRLALPTPPRTRHSRKRKRSPSLPRAHPAKTRRSRVTDSDSEVDDHVLDDRDHASDREPADDTVHHTHKRRRTLRLDALAAELTGKAVADAAAEDAFWTGTSSVLPIAPDASTQSSKEKGKAPPPRAPNRGRSPPRSPTRPPSSSPPARLLRRNHTGLISPPPSRRQPAPVVLPVTPPPLPRTPKKARSLKKKLFPERDSPNNPFLVPAESPDAVLGSSPEAEPTTPTPLPYVEKPTITYVFRGVKAEFENPLYDPSHPGRITSPAPDSPSQLPESHPDFSPTPYCPPRLLFREARKRDHARARKSKPQKGAGDVSNGNGSNGNAGGAERSGDPEKKGVPVPSTPMRKGPSSSKEKGRSRSRSAPKSEWDSSDEEDNASTSRPGKGGRHELDGVKPRLPTDAYPILDNEDEDRNEVEEQMKKMPRNELQKLAKMAPLLLGAASEKR